MQVECWNLIHFKMKSNRLLVIKRHLEANKTAPSRYHYTSNESDILTEADKKFYEENGYLVVRKLISTSKINQYKERFQQICDKQVEVPFLTMMKDVSCVSDGTSQMSVNKIQDFMDDPVLFQYCEDKEILKYAEAFVGKNIMAMHTMLINKPPDPGTKSSRHPLHQDLYYFPFRPADRVVASWTAMQRITRENGCLVVLPGTHRGHLLQHDYPEWEGGVNKMYHGVRDFDSTTPRVYLEMDIGDTVFFHPILIHGSGANKSNNFRKAISCHFASSDCHYIDVEGTIQENISKEVKEVVRRRYGRDVELDYRDVWSMKGRVVQGYRINL